MSDNDWRIAPVEAGHWPTAEEDVADYRRHRTCSCGYVAVGQPTQIEALWAEHIASNAPLKKDGTGEVCTRHSLSNEQIGAACPVCGHTNLVHPQAFANPALTACAICLILHSGLTPASLGTIVPPPT